MKLFNKTRKAYTLVTSRIELELDDALTSQVSKHKRLVTEYASNRKAEDMRSDIELAEKLRDNAQFIKENQSKHAEALAIIASATPQE